jgi:hypothetical protein
VQITSTKFIQHSPQTDTDHLMTRVLKKQHD